MDAIDTEEMTPGFQAFVLLFIGGGFVTVGIISVLFFWPLAVVCFLIGILAWVAAPIIGVTAWRKQRAESA